MIANKDEFKHGSKTICFITAGDDSVYMYSACLFKKILADGVFTHRLLPVIQHTTDDPHGYNCDEYYPINYKCTLYNNDALRDTITPEDMIILDNLHAIKVEWNRCYDNRIDSLVDLIYLSPLDYDTKTLLLSILQYFKDNGKTQIGFEAWDCDLATDDDGNLILLDIFFDYELEGKIIEDYKTIGKGYHITKRDVVHLQ
jgi:hypothetical protein